MRVYEKYLKGKPAVVLSIVAKGKGADIIKPDTWSMYERNIPENSGEDTLALRPGTSDFDRSVIPSPGPNPVVNVPEVYTATTANGISITGAVNSEVPTTTIRLRIPAGQTRESLDTLGLAQITAQMLNEATNDHTSEELSNELRKLGSSISVSSGDNFAVLNIRSLTSNLDRTLEIAKEKLTQPKFAEDDFGRLQKQTIEGLKNAKKNAGTTATNVFTQILFGADNAFARPDAGTIATVSKLNVADAKTYYDNTFGPMGSDIQVVSNLPRNEIVKKLGIFGDWEGANTDAPALKPYPELKAGTLYFIDKPDAAQSEIRIGKRDLNYDATGNFFRTELMNYNLGGAFNSRINLNLREDKGYTYGARSFFYANDYRGAYRAQAAVRANTTVDSIQQFVNEIGSFQKDGMSEKELAFLKNSLGQRDARAYETPRQKLGYLSEIANYDLKPDFVTEQNDVLQNITLDELNALAAKHLKFDEMIMVVVGDKKALWDDLKSLGNPMVELDADGNVVEE